MGVHWVCQHVLWSHTLLGRHLQPGPAGPGDQPVGPQPWRRASVGSDKLSLGETRLRGYSLILQLGQILKTCVCVFLSLGMASPTCGTLPPSSVEWASSWWEPVSPGTTASWDCFIHSRWSPFCGWVALLSSCLYHGKTAVKFLILNVESLTCRIFVQDAPTCLWFNLSQFIGLFWIKESSKCINIECSY